MKKAYLVFISVGTRVVLEDNATEQDILHFANIQLINNLLSDGIGDYIDSINEDVENPYDPEFD